MNSRMYLIKQSLDDYASAFVAGSLVPAGAYFVPAGAYAGFLSEVVANKFFREVLAKNIEESAGKMTPKERLQLQKRVGKVKGVPVRVLGSKELKRLGGESFRSRIGGRDLGEVLIKKRTPDFVLAHELGHARNRPFWSSRRVSKINQLSQGAGPIIGGGAGAIWAALGADPEESSLRTGVKSGLKGALTGVIVHSPQLVEEAQASLYGLRGMHRANVPIRNIMRAIPGLGALYATYLMRAILPAAGIAAGVGLSARETKKQILEDELRKKVRKRSTVKEKQRA